MDRRMEMTEALAVLKDYHHAQSIKSQHVSEFLSDTEDQAFTP